MFVTAWAVGIGLAILVFTVCLHVAHSLGRGHPRPHFRVLQQWHVHLAHAAVWAVIAGFIAGAVIGVAGYKTLYGPGGVLEPPLVAQHPHGQRGGHGHKGTGYIPPHRRKGRPASFSIFAVPAAIDLSNWAPTVGNQGSLNSCASWVVSELRDWYANRNSAVIPRGAAPMYVYSQASGGANQGTTFAAVYNILVQQGIDSRADYYQGDYDYANMPTVLERGNAARWRAAGYQQLFAGVNQGTYARAAIEQSLAGGNPVSIGVPVYDNFYNAGTGSYYIAGVSGNYYGGHALLVLKYDTNGVWVQNSWGTSWGLNGFAELSWSFIEQYALEADQLVMPNRTPPVLPMTRYRVTRTQSLRAQPYLASHREVLERRGAIVWGYHQSVRGWLHVRDTHGHSGWVLRANIRRA